MLQVCRVGWPGTPSLPNLLEGLGRLCSLLRPTVQAADAPSRLCKGCAGLPPAARASADRQAPALPPGMVALPGGRCTMGSDRFDPEEQPLREAEAGPSAIQRHEVTHAQLAAFVAATGYRTLAERPLDSRQCLKLSPQAREPGALVFRQPATVRDMVDISQWWAWTPGTSWRVPDGPGSSIKGRDTHPVVHLACEDGMACARWTGQDPPTAAEWEDAARGGLAGAADTWGNDRHARDALGRRRARHTASTPACRTWASAR